MIGRVTDTGRMVLKFNGETVCDIPLGPLADDAPVYDRPFVRTAAARRLADVPECTDIAADLLKLMASPDIASPPLDLGAIRHAGRRRHRPAPRRRRRGGARPRHAKGPGDHHRLHAALLLRRPVRGRQAGDRRSLAQPLRGRREAARHHRLPEFRQPAAARDHGPVRRLHRGHGRGLPRARLPDRERQRLALQRDQERRRHRLARSCPPPRSAASACSRIGTKSATIAFKQTGDVDPR